MKKPPPKQKKISEPEKENPKTIPAQEFFLNKISENKLVLIAGALLLLMLLGAFNQYIFGDRLLLFKDIGTDTIDFNWPAYYHYSQYLHTEGIPLWSFSQGLGQNIFPANLGDVASWLIYLPAPENIPYMLVYIQVLKILLGGLFFYLFLKKIRLSAYSALIGASLYAFSGFMIIGSTWFIFTTEGCYLALLLYGLELLRQKNNLFVFPLAVALITAYNPLFIYMDMLLALAYLFSVFFLTGFSKQVFPLAGKMVLLGILGLGMGSFLMFGDIYQVIQSPRWSSSVSYTSALSSLPLFKPESSTYYSTFLLRMFGNDMTGGATAGMSVGAPDYTGWRNYLEDPMQYCGLLSLLLIPQLFVSVNRKTKLLTGFVLAAAVLPVIFPYFRYAFWLFSGDYFRTYSLFFSVLEILLAVKTLDIIIRQQKINLTLLAGTLFVCLAGIFLLPAANGHLKIPVSLFLVAEASLLWMITRPSLHRTAFIVLPLIVFAEISYLSRGTFNDRDTMTKSELEYKAGYNDYTVNAVKYIQTADKGFYRLHKTYPSTPTGAPESFNDAMIQDYYSSSSYYSFNQKNYVEFLQKMKVISDTSESQSRWIIGLKNSPMLNQIISNKYLLFRGAFPYADAFGYDSMTDVNGIRIYKNRFFVPLGFTYNKYITESEISGMEPAAKSVAMIKGVVVNAGTLPTDRLAGMTKVSEADIAMVTTYSGLYDDFLNLRKDTLQITSFKQNYIQGNIDAGRKELLFFSIPYDKGWKARIDDKEVDAYKVNYGFLGYLIEKGNHRVELRYELPYYKAGATLSLVSFVIFAGLGIFVFIKRKKKTLL